MIVALAIALVVVAALMGWRLMNREDEWSRWMEGTTTNRPLFSGLRHAPPLDPDQPEATMIPEHLQSLISEAHVEATKAMRRFPQPNYVISKVAEEAGEVVKAAIHCAEGRETAENVRSEIKQAMAMLMRLYLEGDQVHGLPPICDQSR